GVRASSYADAASTERLSLPTRRSSDLAAVLSNGEPGLGMHCDIVVGITIGPDRRRIAHLVGGNVHDTVAMRRLALTPGDRFQDLPMRQPGDPDCSPESVYACDLNRQDWSVLLQLRPAADLAALAPPPPVPPGPGATPAGVPAPAPGGAPEVTPQRCC